MTTTATPSPVAAPTRHPIRWIALTTAVVLIGVFGTVFALQLGDDARLSDSPLIGKPAPDFDLPGLDGGRVRLSDYVGRPVVVNFWASWCVPCREEAPRLESFQVRHATDGATVIGIVWNDSTDAARQFRTEFGLTFPQAVDPDSRAAIDYGVRGVPETYVVAPNGVVMAKVVGAVGPTTLDDILADVLAGRTRAERNERDYRTRPPG